APVGRCGGAPAAAALAARGGGGLVCSLYSDDRACLGAAVGLLAPHHGRIYVGSAKVAGQTPGPGTALPQLLHGGPGRAGGGEELGGLHGLGLYLQRTALEGDKALIEGLGRGEATGPEQQDTGDRQRATGNGHRVGRYDARCPLPVAG